MKILHFIIVVLCLKSFLWADSQRSKYLLALAVVTKSDPLTKKHVLDEDKKQVFDIAFRLLQSRCDIVDDTLSDALGIEKVPLKLTLTCQINSIQDRNLPLYRHQAIITGQVIERLKTATFYGNVRKSSPLILIPPLQKFTLEYWKNNRRSRNRAISEALRRLIPKLLKSMDLYRARVKSFQIKIAKSLSLEEKHALQILLGNMKSSNSNITTKNISSLGATLNFKYDGILTFVENLRNELACNKVLYKTTCFTDGAKVIVKSKTPSRPKFYGSLMLFPDTKEYANVQILKTMQTDLFTLHNKLKEYLQIHFGQVFEPQEKKRHLHKLMKQMGQLAATNPQDYLARIHGEVAYSVLFSCSTRVKKVKSDVYCYASINIRVFRQANRGEILNISLDSPHGILTTIANVEKAKQKAINILTKKAILPIVSRIQSEKDITYLEAFDLHARNNELEKLTSILNELNDEEHIKLESDIIVRNQSISCRLTFPKGSKKNKPGRANFLELLQERIKEEGMSELTVKNPKHSMVFVYRFDSSKFEDD